MTSQAESSCATCPLMVAVLPLRYAIGPTSYTGELLNGLELPDLPRTFPSVVHRYRSLQDRPLGYVPRLLRTGWLYVWVGAEDRLIEYQITSGLLKETPRGGSIVDSRQLSYLQVPSGDPIALNWSPVKWPDSHYQKLADNAAERAKHMREIVPGSSSQSLTFTESVYDSLPEVIASSDFDWAGNLPTIPFWPNLDRQMNRLEQQAVALVDDPWGVIHDLAALIRLTQESQEARRAEHGDKWGLAGVIRELSNGDAQLRQKLPELTDYRVLQETWREADKSQLDYENIMTALVDSWAEWLGTLNCEGIGTLHSACESFDLADGTSRDLLEDYFSISLMGPTYLSRGAAAVGRTMALKGEHTPWLWYTLLGLKDKLTLGEIEKLVTLGEHLSEAGDDIGAAMATFVNAINKGLIDLNLHMPAAPTEAFFSAISPVAGAELNNLPDRVGPLGSGFLVAALSRTGTELAVENVDRIKVNQWLSEAANTARPSKLPAANDADAGRKVPVFWVQAAKYSHHGPSVVNLTSGLTNPYTLEDAIFKKAKLRSFLVVLTGLNFLHAGSDWLEKEDLKTRTTMVGSVLGTVAAYSSIHHKLSELNWSDGLSESANPEALSHAWGIAASGLSAATVAVDIIVFGLSAFESYKQGDFDTAGLELGLVAVSAGQLHLSVTAFRAYREARAVALGAQTASAVRGLSRLGGWFTALSIGLTATLVGGLVTRFYIENSPLEDWVANTRFGVMPAKWSSDFVGEMQQLYKAVFPIKLCFLNSLELNPRTNEHVQICMILLELPGQSKLSDEMIYFKGFEKLETPAHQTQAFNDEEIRKLFTEEQQEKLLSPEFRFVEWNGEDFDQHLGTRVSTSIGTVVYRRIYHGKDRIEGLEGTLIYQPQPGLTMPSLEVDL